MARGKSFSERMGHTPEKLVQLETVDQPLRNLLWDECSMWLKMLWNSVRPGNPTAHTSQAFQFLRHLWVDWFRVQFDEIYDPYDSMSNIFEKILNRLASVMTSRNTQWFIVFDLIEFVLQLNVAKNIEMARNIFTEAINQRLEEERSGYRIVGQHVVALTDPTQLKAIENASTPVASSLDLASIHICKAKECLADRATPDYRNSIKEAVSAVETLCKKLANMPDATLGPALDKVAKELDLNDHLRDGVKAIYKYTSDKHGIRHGLKDHDQPSLEDAMFMLVTCSAFVNFVIEKARKQNKLPT